MIKFFFALSTLFALARGFSIGQKYTPASVKTPLTQITYNEGNFSGTNGFTVTKNGSGFLSDSTYTNGFNISDTSSYIEVNPGEHTAIASEHGFSIGLYLSSKAGEETNVYEQLFTIETSSGKLSYICVAGLYYMASSSATVEYSMPNGTNKLSLDEKEKYQIFTVDFDNGVIYDYVNGVLVNQFTPSNSKAEVIEKAIETFKELKNEGQGFFIRKPCSKRSGRNTTSIVASEISIFNSVITAEEAEAMFTEKGAKTRTDLPITVASCDDYTLTSVGYGIVDYASDKPNSFNIEDQTSYLSFKAASDKKLTQNGKGFSLSFYQKSTTDTFYSGNTSLRPNVTDDFEQLLTVEDDTGASAYICMGGIYYSEDGVDSTYAMPRPSGTGQVLLTTSWKYVTINVDAVNFSVIVYIDGVATQFYDQTHPTRAAMIKTVVTMFENAVSSLGGEIFLRKPFPPKVQRNSATNIFDEMVFNECMTVNEIKMLHDSKLGKIRVIFEPNIDVPFEDIVSTTSITIPQYDGGEVEGYVFDGYYFDKEHTLKVPDNYVTTESVIIYPYFVPIKYTITYHLDGGTNNENNPSEYTSEQKVTFLDASKVGCAFQGWYRTDKFENKVEMLVEGSYGNIDLYAKFVPNAFKITYILNGGLLIEEAVESFTANDGIISLPKAWKPGLAFVGWYTDELLTQKVESIDASCAHDVTLYANFTNIYTITYILNGGQLGDGAVNTFTIYDGIIALPTATKNGYQFDGWYVDEGLTEKIENIDSSIGRNIILYAKFIENSVEPEEKKTKSNNVGLIVGLSVGGAAFLGGSVVLIIFLVRRKRI